MENKKAEPLIVSSISKGEAQPNLDQIIRSWMDTLGSIVTMVFQKQQYLLRSCPLKRSIFKLLA